MKLFDRMPIIVFDILPGLINTHKPPLTRKIRCYLIHACLSALSRKQKALDNNHPLFSFLPSFLSFQCRPQAHFNLYYTRMVRDDRVSKGKKACMPDELELPTEM